MNVKATLCKSLSLDKCLVSYQAGGRQKEEAFTKFKNVFGEFMANHLLSKYDDAKSFIWALDSDNLEKFIKKW